MTGAISFSVGPSGRRIVDAQGRSVANLHTAFCPAFSRDEAEVITRLLSASPDLYRALVFVRPVLIAQVAELSAAADPKHRRRLRRGVFALQALQKTLEDHALIGDEVQKMLSGNR